MTPVVGIGATVVGIGATVVVGASVTVVGGRVVVVTGLLEVVVLRTVEGVAPIAKPCPTATQRNRVIRIAVRRTIEIRRAIAFILDHGRCLAVSGTPLRSSPPDLAPSRWTRFVRIRQRLSYRSVLLVVDRGHHAQDAVTADSVV